MHGYVKKASKQFTKKNSRQIATTLENQLDGKDLQAFESLRGDRRFLCHKRRDVKLSPMYVRILAHTAYFLASFNQAENRRDAIDTTEKRHTDVTHTKPRADVRS